MIYFWVALLTACVVFCLWTLIHTRKSPVTTFVLVPLLLIASVYSVNLFYHIQGTPKSGLPTGQVEILYIAISKPNIYLLVKSDKAEHPVYHRIDYTQQRAQQMRNLMKAMQTEQLRGELRMKSNGNTTIEQDIVFENLKHIPLPAKEN